MRRYRVLRALGHKKQEAQYPSVKGCTPDPDQNPTRCKELLEDLGKLLWSESLPLWRAIALSDGNIEKLAPCHLLPMALSVALAARWM